MAGDEFSIKEVVLRMEKNTEEGLRRVSDTVSNIDAKLDKHVEESIEVTKDVATLKTTVADHQSVLYDPQTGLIYRMKSVESFAETQKKVMWEIAKPGLAMIGTILLIGVGILGILAYGLQVILQNLTP